MQYSGGREGEEKKRKKSDSSFPLSSLSEVQGPIHTQTGSWPDVIVEVLQRNGTSKIDRQTSKYIIVYIIDSLSIDINDDIDIDKDIDIDI